MVCCVVVAMLFALPFILARGLYGLITGGQCSMAWRPALAAGPTASHQVITNTRSVNRVVTGRGFTIADRVKSFGHAGRGAVRLLRFEHSAWIQLSIASIAVVLAVVLNISLEDWRWIVVACGLVLSLEGLNTAVERTCDRISVDYCGQIKVAKDVAAGAVLLGSIAAALIGFLTFLPYVTAPDAVAGSLPALDSSSQMAPQNDALLSQFAVFHCLSSSQPESALPVTGDDIARVGEGV